MLILEANIIIQIMTQILSLIIKYDTPASYTATLASESNCKFDYNFNLTIICASITMITEIWESQFWIYEHFELEKQK